MTTHALSTGICPTCEEAPRTLRGELRAATLPLVIENNNKLRALLREAHGELENYVADCESYEAPENIEQLKATVAKIAAVLRVGEDKP